MFRSSHQAAIQPALPATTDTAPGGCRQPACRLVRGERETAVRVAIVVASARAVEVCALFAPSRGPACVALARQIAMYLAHVACGLTLTGVGRGFGRDRTTAAHACMVVEEKRDDIAFDALVARLESRLADAREGGRK